MGVHFPRHLGARRGDLDRHARSLDADPLLGTSHRRLPAGDELFQQIAHAPGDLGFGLVGPGIDQPGHAVAFFVAELVPRSLHLFAGLHSSGEQQIADLGPPHKGAHVLRHWSISRSCRGSAAARFNKKATVTYCSHYSPSRVAMAASIAASISSSCHAIWPSPPQTARPNASRKQRYLFASRASPLAA